MSGFKFCVVAAAVVCAACVGAPADPAPIEPVLIPYPSLDMPLTDLAPAADAAPSTIGAPPATSTSTAIPLPAGVYVGLVGLASAAIARRRYLKRR